MSISVAGMLEQGKDVVVEAALVKELGNNFEKLLPEIARSVAPDLSLESPEAQRLFGKPLKKPCCCRLRSHCAAVPERYCVGSSRADWG